MTTERTYFHFTDPNNFARLVGLPDGSWKFELTTTFTPQVGERWRWENGSLSIIPGPHEGCLKRNEREYLGHGTWKVPQ